MPVRAADFDAYIAAGQMRALSDRNPKNADRWRAVRTAVQAVATPRGTWTMRKRSADGRRLIRRAERRG